MTVLYRILKTEQGEFVSNSVFRIEDWASIPTNIENSDYLKVLTDLKEQGNSVFENSEVSNKVYQDSISLT